jgi:hypothetical protein
MLSVKRCCELAGVSRALAYYEPRQKPPHMLASEISRVADEKPAYGYRRVARKLCKEGFEISEKDSSSNAEVGASKAEEAAKNANDVFGAGR